MDINNDSGDYTNCIKLMENLNVIYLYKESMIQEYFPIRFQDRKIIRQQRLIDTAQFGRVKIFIQHKLALVINNPIYKLIK